MIAGFYRNALSRHPTSACKNKNNKKKLKALQLYWHSWELLLTHPTYRFWNKIAWSFIYKDIYKDMHTLIIRTSSPQPIVFLMLIMIALALTLLLGVTNTSADQPSRNQQLLHLRSNPVTSWLPIAVLQHRRAWFCFTKLFKDTLKQAFNQSSFVFSIGLYSIYYYCYCTCYHLVAWQTA